MTRGASLNKIFSCFSRTCNALEIPLAMTVIWIALSGTLKHFWKDIFGLCKCSPSNWGVKLKVLPIATIWGKCYRHILCLQEILAEGPFGRVPLVFEKKDSLPSFFFIGIWITLKLVFVDAFFGFWILQTINIQYQA